jgi:hypothetical protein
MATSMRGLRAITGRCITPPQPIPDYEDDPAHDPPVIDSRNPVGQWKIRLDPTHLRLIQQPQIRQSQHLLGADVESIDCLKCKRFNRS